MKSVRKFIVIFLTIIVIIISIILINNYVSSTSYKRDLTTILYQFGIDYHIIINKQDINEYHSYKHILKDNNYFSVSFYFTKRNRIVLMKYFDDSDSLSNHIEIIKNKLINNLNLKINGEQYKDGFVYKSKFNTIELELYSKEIIIEPYGKNIILKLEY